MMTNFYYLRAKQVDYDCYDAFVIEAESEEMARERAAGEYGDNAKDWLNPEATTCELLVLTGTPHVVIGSFNAG